MLPLPPKPRRVLLTLALATLAIFGGLVAVFTFRLRVQLREEILRREAESIHAVAQLQLRLAEERQGPFDPSTGLQAAFAAVLEASKLSGVISVQVFDRAGDLHAALPVFPEAEQVRRWWSDVPRRPQARFHAAGSLEAAVGLEVETGVPPTRAPLLDVIVPIQGQVAGVFGATRFWVDGAPVAAEFRRMNRRLAVQGGVAFASGAVLVGLVLAWAYTQLAAAHRRLLEQSADLERANQELDFAAKTGALGAISAHLIHGLNNPLAGLEGFVAETAAGTGETPRGEAGRAAIETTRRLRALVTEVTTVLRDEADGGADYLVPLDEVVEAARMRASSAAQQSGVQLSAKADAGGHLTARRANLAGLVLANLLANAIEATPRGSGVSLEVRMAGGRAEFLIKDEGPGLPEAVQAALFRPMRSSKPGGGGVGLAISHRLARHAGGDLEYVRSNTAGTVFRLTVPLSERP